MPDRRESKPEKPVPTTVNADGQGIEGKLLKIFTDPLGARITVAGHEIGFTGTEGLSVPWNLGPILIEKTFYQPVTLTFSSPPEESSRLVRLERGGGARLIRLLIVCAVVAGMMGAGGLVFWKRYAVQGLVVETDPGSVDVAVVGVPGEPRRTDSSGRLTIPMDGPRKVALRFSKDCYHARSLEFDYDPAGNTRVPKVTLKRQCAELQVTTDPGNVDVLVNGVLEGTTNRDGDLLIHRIPVDKTVHLRFVKKGYHGVDVSVDLPAEPLHRVGLVRLTELRGTVEVAANQPDAEILVRHSGEDRVAGKTLSDGRFVIQGLPFQTTFYILGKKPGFGADPIGPFKLSEERPSVTDAKIVFTPLVAKLEIRTKPGNVAVALNGKRIGFTNSDGTTTLPGLQVEVPHELKLSRTGFADLTLPVTIPELAAGGTFKLEEIAELKPSTVVSPADQAVLVFQANVPRAEVSVSVGGEVRMSGTTDEKGICRLTGLQFDVDMRAKIRKRGWQETGLGPFRFSRENPAKTIEKIVMKRVSADVELRIELAKVQIQQKGSPMRVTDQDGRLLLKDVPVGQEQVLTLEKAGHQSKQLKFTVPNDYAGDVFVLKPDKLLSQTPQEITVRVTVRVSEPDADVSWMQDGKLHPAGKTDKHGDCTFDVPADTAVTIKIRKEGWEETLAPLMLTGNKKTEAIGPIRLVRAKASLVIQTEPPSVTVRVKNSPERLADSSGRVEIPGLDVNVEQEIEFSREGFQKVERKVTVPAAFAGKEYSLPEKVRLTAIDRPKTGVLVIRSVPAAVDVFVNDEYKNVTDGSGNADIPDLPAGKVRVKFEKTGYETKIEEIEIRAGAKELKKVELAPLKTRLTANVKTPLTDVTVKSDGYEQSRRTGPDGGPIDFTDIPLNRRVRVTFSRPGWTSVERTDIEFSEKRLTIELGNIALTQKTATLVIATDGGSGIKVTLDRNREQFTDYSGICRFPQVSLGADHDLTLQKKGCRESHDIVSIPVDHDERKPYQKKVEPPAPNHVSVELKTSPGEVEVHLGGKWIKTTNSDGSAKLSDIPVGVEHKITLKKSGYEPLLRDLLVPGTFEGAIYSWDKELTLKKEAKPVSVDSPTRSPRQDDSPARPHRQEESPFSSPTPSPAQEPKMTLPGGGFGHD